MTGTLNLDELEALEAKATQGKWFSDQTYVTDYPNGDGRDIALTSGKHCHENAAFIAAARNAVPELIAALRTAWAERAEADQLRHDTQGDAVRLMMERDARPSPEVVAKVRQLLQGISSDDCTDYRATPCVIGMHDKNCRQLGAREALRLLEAGGR